MGGTSRIPATDGYRSPRIPAPSAVRHRARPPARRRPEIADGMASRSVAPRPGPGGAGLPSPRRRASPVRRDSRDWTHRRRLPGCRGLQRGCASAGPRWAAMSLIGRPSKVASEASNAAMSWAGHGRCAVVSGRSPLPTGGRAGTPAASVSLLRCCRPGTARGGRTPGGPGSGCRRVRHRPAALRGPRRGGGRSGSCAAGCAGRSQFGRP